MRGIVNNGEMRYILETMQTELLRRTDENEAKDYLLKTVTIYMQKNKRKEKIKEK